ncbi:hypothetical protein C8R43DRAFT_1127994 [Mycena crocata]|nr:hypothetical protein C8R43DRAFT_1127994 [Mycena crocata]
MDVQPPPPRIRLVPRPYGVLQPLSRRKILPVKLKRCLLRLPRKPPSGQVSPITRVAVIGAGPSGLQAAAHLLASNLTVRLFEHAPSPGGNWFYTEDTPVREAYPEDVVSDKMHKVPKNPPATLYYDEGQEGTGLEDHWKEHWQPRPVWYNLHTNSPGVRPSRSFCEHNANALTDFPGIKYSVDMPWSVSVHDVQQHVRAYTSPHRLNSNDKPIPPANKPVTSYSTRVEKIKKCNTTSMWTLTLRRLECLPESKRLQAEF